jgi:glutamate dehydrogenase
MSLPALASKTGAMRQILELLGPDPQASAFAKVLLGRDGQDGLTRLDPPHLAELTREAVAFIARKPKAQHKVRMRTLATPADGEELSLLEISNDDMPFLVDSILGELQVRGLGVLALLHPIFKTERDGSGRLNKIIGPGDEDWDDGHQESYIAVLLNAVPAAMGKEIVAAISALLNEVRVAVSDWGKMRQRLNAAIGELETVDRPSPADLRAEALAFLRWLLADNFTFLGMREFELTGDPETGTLVPLKGSGLGVLRDAALEVLRRGSELLAMTPEIRRFFFAPAPLIITKANVVSRVHRRAHMDYIGIKTYRPDGALKGELRLIGLFTSQAYVRLPSEIPFLRLKVAKVLAGSGYPPGSHAGKALTNILNTFPRDELFQIGVERLQEWSEGILDLETRPRVRVFARVDRFDRFVSLIIYVPRDRYNTGVRERIGALLAQAYQGRVTAFYPYFPEGPLVRVQFIIGRQRGPTPDVDPAWLEAEIARITRTWQDRLAQAIAGLGPSGEALLAKYGAAFPAGYAEGFSPERALQDIERIERLGPERPIAVDFYRLPDAPPGRLHAAVYRFGEPIALSERVPVLENLGFRAIDERSFHLTPRFAGSTVDVTLHDMVLERADGAGIELSGQASRLEGCFLAVFRGEADNDGFNRLILSAGADWREVALIRAYSAYLRQLQQPFGLRYLADTLTRHAGLTRDLIELFHVRFDPQRRLSLHERERLAEPIRQRIEGALANVPSLDEDRILRQVLNLLSATVRTNFYQADARGRRSEVISFKFDSALIEAAPHPRPFRELWVYCPRVEGIHLRFAPIARGGIRWSDRAQDFRTEILGLVRAQRVKNAVIVPSGAKGGFLPKQLPRSANRDEVQKEGIAAYRVFIAALLDITDNLKDGRIVPPAQVVRYDGDDPYLVVAADKGTATFSDIANEISAGHDFWLGDAFASGGSEGYDHKAMAITARGAWTCVERHFREMDIDIERQPFRVIGVGDMSGDVFGNGMLLSPVIRLQAAFDHRDIFIDPDPDPDQSFSERKRLFALPRSSWQDYDRSKISRGGGVFSRSAKSITLTPEMAALIGVSPANLTPNDLMHALLKSTTDLLWFGGIGTYVRATGESDVEVGDRANDAIRVTAADLGARVVGEGANLGMTQRARIEFAHRGGRLNTDSIDNSAGVNTSDQEVNIKIALGPASRSGKLSASERKLLLAAMTDAVAARSLANNYQQSLALSLAERSSNRELPDYALLLHALEERGLFERRLEALPSDRELEERGRTGRGLTRPELAVLLSYAKIALEHDLVASKVPDEPLLETWLDAYFPDELRRRFPEGISGHSLRREIIATGLTNAVLNRGGPALAVRLADETRRTTPDVALAFLAVRETFELPALWGKLDALDGKVKGATQIALYQRTRDLLTAATLFMLRHASGEGGLGDSIARHRLTLAALKSALASVLPARLAQGTAQQADELKALGVPDDLASEIAALDVLEHSLAIDAVAHATHSTVPEAARVFLLLGDRLRIGELASRASKIVTPDYYDRLAVAQALNQLGKSQAELARAAIRAGGAAAIEAWLERQGPRLARVIANLEAIANEGTLTLSRLLVAAGQLQDVAGAATAAAPSASAKRARTGGRSRSGASESQPARKRVPSSPA